MLCQRLLPNLRQTDHFKSHVQSIRWHLLLDLADCMVGKGRDAQPEWRPVRTRPTIQSHSISTHNGGGRAGKAGDTAEGQRPAGSVILGCTSHGGNPLAI